jgi:hypothetical protein
MQNQNPLHMRKQIAGASTTFPMAKEYSVRVDIVGRLSIGWPPAASFDDFDREVQRELRKRHYRRLRFDDEIVGYEFRLQLKPIGDNTYSVVF